MSPYELTAYVASTAMALIGCGSAQVPRLSCVRSVAYENTRLDGLAFVSPAIRLNVLRTL
jgi:hypothetical protein